MHKVVSGRIDNLNRRGAIQFLGHDVAQHIVENGVIGGVAKLRDVERRAAIRRQDRAGTVFVNANTGYDQDH